MLEKTLQHSNLGSQSQIIYIIDLLFKSDCSIEDLKTMCVSKEYSFSDSFNGIIRLLQWLNIIKIPYLVSLNKHINSQNFIIEICNLLFLQLEKEKQLQNLFNSDNLIFQDYIYIKNSLIKLEFSPIRNFLINLNFFKKDNLIYNQFVINEKNFRNGSLIALFRLLKIHKFVIAH